MPGPMPKRVEERRRRNKVPGETLVPMEGEVVVPELPAGTHEIARDWYESLKHSGQSQYFEPSDWAAARYVAAVMTKNLTARRFSAQHFVGVWAAMTDLLSTEEARRKAKIQVQRVYGMEGPEEKPVSIEDRRKAIGG